MSKSRNTLCLLLWLTLIATASAETTELVNVHARVQLGGGSGTHRSPAAVLWLKPLSDTPPAPFVPSENYTLLQKNRMFKPHLLVIPVGSVVQFPNADPFFHNVFSLFDGKRFDLGLYEAGSTKSVTFSREGVSYIFCNIHPEMSAVVLTLSTRLFAVAAANGSFRIADVPVGDYEVHLWIEGVQQPVLNGMSRRIHLASDSGDLGTFEVPSGSLNPSAHTNMYGKPYEPTVKAPY